MIISEFFDNTLISTSNGTLEFECNCLGSQCLKRKFYYNDFISLDFEVCSICKSTFKLFFENVGTDISFPSQLEYKIYNNKVVFFEHYLLRSIENKYNFPEYFQIKTDELYRPIRFERNRFKSDWVLNYKIVIAEQTNPNIYIWASLKDVVTLISDIECNKYPLLNNYKWGLFRTLQKSFTEINEDECFLKSIPKRNKIVEKIKKIKKMPFYHDGQFSIEIMDLFYELIKSDCQ